MTDRRMTRIVTGVVVAVLLTTAASAQWSGRRGGFGSRYPPRFRPTGQLDRGFIFCRLMYTSDRRERSGRGWSTDYPFADINFMTRLSELTTTRVNLDSTDEPNHWVIPVADEGLYTCPFVMTSDVGTMRLIPEEATRLRDYLLKGGFLWVDDFWGTRAWDQWATEISKVLPPSTYPIVDLPLDHELFRTMFNIREIPQISNIHFGADRVVLQRLSGDTTVPSHTSELSPTRAAGYSWP